ncbi:MAG: hypothetical protein ABH878_04870 [bacterium]
MVIPFESKLRISSGVFTGGLILAGTQVLIIRRAMSLCGGDELVFALSLALWLLFIAAGSFLGTRTLKRFQNPLKVFKIILFFVSISSPMSLLTLNTSSYFFGWVSGTAPGGGGLFWALCLSLLPICIAGGIFFPISCRLFALSTNQAVNRVYYLETAGSFFAGALLAFIFAPHLGALTFALFFFFLGVGITLSLILTRFPVWLILACTVVLTVLSRPTGIVIERKLLSNLRPGFNLKDVLETPFGLLEVSERAGQINVYENGLLLALSDNPEEAEERAHFALAQHRHPETVLWIGGSLGGSLPEALKHPSLRRIDVVEINPVIFDLQCYFSVVEQEVKIDDRVMFFRQDGRRFLARSAPERYDLVVLNLPGPRTARLAKFYSIEGFSIIKRALKPDGLLVFMIPSSEDYIGADLAVLLSSLKRTLEAVFPNVTILPGANAIYIAGNDDAQPITNPGEISRRLSSRGILPQYWDEYRLEDRLLPSRFAALQQALVSAQDIELNRDTAPISFYLQQLLWSRQTRGGLSQLLRYMMGKFSYLCWIVVLLSTVPVLFVKRKWFGNPVNFSIGWAVFTVGLIGFSLELLAMTAYQVQIGSGYREVGLLVGFYMAGLTLGAYITRKWLWNLRSSLILLQICWLILPASLFAIVQIQTALSLPMLVCKISFYGVLLLVGMCGGSHFPLAVRIVQENGIAKAGTFYGLDVIGAALGALFSGVFALPLIGMTNTLLFLSLLNLAPTVLLVTSTSRQ